MSIQFDNTAAGVVTLKPGASGSYSMTLPTSNASGGLVNDGSGNLSFGTVPNATTAVVAGTVTTAAQGNITSVGTLSSLSVTGNIISSGKVGIGTSSPTQKLHVAGDALFDYGSNNINTVYVGAGNEPSLRLGQSGNDSYVSAGTSGGQSTSLIFQTAVGSAAITEKMRIDSSGNVGIGTASPTLKLTVQDNGNQLRIRNTTTRYRSDFSVGVASGLNINSYDDTGTVYLPFNIDASVITFSPSGSEKVRITSSAAGELLVGSTSALQSSANRGVIQVNGTSQSIFTMAVGGAVKGYLYNDGTNQTVTAATGALIFEVPTERMRIDSGGNVLVATTSQIRSGVLSVSGIISTNNNINWGPAGNGRIFSDVNWGCIFQADRASPASAEFMWQNAGGTERMRIDTSGNVGIGTSSPSTKLHVAGATAIARIDRTADASANPELQLTAVGRQFNVGVGGATFATAALQGAYYLYDSTGSTYRMVIDVNGNVGIGTTTITDKLTINGASRTISATVYASGAVQTGNLYWGWEMYNVNSTTNYLQSYNRFSSAYMDSVYNAATHQFWISGAERMRVNSSGYVGIATSTPAALLQVGPTSAGAINGYTKFIVDSSDYAVISLKCPAANFNQIIFTDPTSAGLGGINYFNSTNATPNAMAFLTAATERVRIDSSGNVGIGTNSNPGTPVSGRLSVLPAANPTTAATSTTLTLGETTNNSAYQLRMAYSYLASTYTGVIDAVQNNAGAPLTINPTGGIVGVGTTAPNASATTTIKQGSSAYQLQLEQSNSTDGYGLRCDAANGDLTFNRYASGAYTERVKFTLDGNIQLSTAGTKILNSSGKPILQQTGSILQVVSATLNTYGSTGSSTYVAVPGLSVAITPASTTNKVLIRGYIWLAGTGQNGVFAAVFRDGSILAGVAGSGAQPNAVENGGGGTVVASGGFIPAAATVTYQATPICFEFLDSPARTSSATYQIYVRVGNGATLLYNYQGTTGGNPDFGYFASTITAQEIVA